MHFRFFPRHCGELHAIASTSALEDTDFNSTLPYCLHFIFFVCQITSQLAKEVGTKPKPKEADWRLPIDALIALAFRTLEDDDGYVLRHLAECTLLLPKSRVIIPTVTSDLAAFIVFPGYLNSLPIHVRKALNVTWLPGAPESDLHVLHWVMEYERELDASNQLHFDMASAVQQRRALGCPDQYVFGACTFGIGALKTYAAKWSASDQLVHVYPLEHYIIMSPRDVARFYLFLRVVAEKANEYRASINSIDKDALPPVAPGYQRWQAPTPPQGTSPRRRPTSRNRSRRGSAGGGDSGYEMRDDLNQNEVEEFTIEEDDLWIQGKANWTRDAADALRLEGRGAPLNAESVQSVGLADPSELAAQRGTPLIPLTFI